MALNNVENTHRCYQENNIDATIQIVAYGPGLSMLRLDKSTVLARLEEMTLAIPDLTISACDNTLRGLIKNEGKAPELLPEVHMVTSGMVHLVDLQRQGYPYIRP